MLRTLFMIATMAGLQGCDLRDAFSANVDTVARAGGQELTVPAMAELLANAKTLPLRRDVVEGVAGIWVDYMLFAERMLTGDSLLDSATVLAARWPEVQQTLADRYHAQLVERVSMFDSAQVDSVYRQGDLRLIRHILFAVGAEDPPDVRQVKFAQAQVLLSQLRAGRGTWEEAATQSEEPGGPERNGSLGVIGRGEMVTPFENAAYALAPGALSDVVETSFGYHIVFRPRLEEVREAFARGLEERLQGTFDNRYLDSLPQRWNAEVRDDAPQRVRELVSNLDRARQSRAVLATWRDGGRFRGADFVRWLQGMDPQLRGMIAGGTDEQITQLVRSLVRNELLLLEAEQAGVALAAEDLATLTDDLGRELAILRAAMGLMPDTLARLVQLPEADRLAAANQLVLGYLRALGANERRFQMVSPFLSERLRDQGDWAIVAAGVERALQRANELRASLDAVAPPAAPPATPPVVPDTTVDRG